MRISMHALIAACLGIVCGALPARAQPDWAGDPGTTENTWTDWSHGSGSHMTPDYSASNPPGITGSYASSVFDFDEQVVDPGVPPHQKVLVLTKPLVLTIKNVNQNNPKKDIWIEWISYGAQDSLILDTAAQADWGLGFQNTTVAPFVPRPAEDLGDGWWKNYVACSMSPNPEAERLTLNLSGGSNVARIDSLSVYTRCIPSPGSVLLMGGAALAGLGRRRRAARSMP